LFSKVILRTYCSNNCHQNASKKAARDISGAWPEGIAEIAAEGTDLDAFS
jgi:hypothetical protein